jgi:pyruvate dehydrogenase E2 component (dihydrolipoamide acetyltransferase)
MATPVIMPKLEMSQETATVVQWLKGDGEAVRKGEPLLTIETDKVTIDVESPESGTLAGIRVEADDVVPVTETIAYILQPGEPLPMEAGTGPVRDTPTDVLAASVAHATPVVPATPVAQRMAADHGLDLSAVAGTGPGGKVVKADVEAAISQARRPDVSAAGKVRATPAARRIARERGLDLGDIPGSGPRGRVQGTDAIAYTPARVEAAPSPAADVEIVPLRGMRRRIAERMTASYRTAPHITLTVQVDVSAVEALRAELNARAESRGAPRISVTALLVKVCAWALKGHRQVNASLHGDEIHLHPSANVGVAIALDEGLIVPVIRQAETLGLAEIAARLRDLADRARQGTLTPQDVSGGTFTITNLGMYGIDQFTAIINPPECAILAVGRIAKQSVVVEQEGRDVAVIVPMMAMTLSADHRVLDGAVAASFLRDVVDALEHPNLLLW